MNRLDAPCPNAQESCNRSPWFSRELKRKNERMETNGKGDDLKLNPLKKKLASGLSRGRVKPQQADQSVGFMFLMFFLYGVVTL